MNPSGPSRQPAPKPRSFAQLVGRSFPTKLVDFVIPDLQRDIAVGLYLTPALAKHHPDPVVRAMYTEAQAFFTTLEALLSSAKQGDVLAMRRAERMAQFPEPYEIGFGYTREGCMGNGMGNGELTERLLDALLEYPALASACAVEPDAVSFIPSFGVDRVSDMVATITKSHLIEFTQNRARRYGFDPACIKSVPVQNIWDPTVGSLVTRQVEVPVADDGRPILLVPKGIVRSDAPVRTWQYARFHYGRGSRMGKPEVLEDLRGDATKLLTAMEDVLSDPRRYKPRREFRSEE